MKLTTKNGTALSVMENAVSPRGNGRGYRGAAGLKAKWARELTNPLAEAPICSLRLPGFAGKCGETFGPITPGGARCLRTATTRLPGATNISSLRDFEVACGCAFLSLGL